MKIPKAVVSASALLLLCVSGASAKTPARLPFGGKPVEFSVSPGKWRPKGGERYSISVRPSRCDGPAFRFSTCLRVEVEKSTPRPADAYLGSETTGAIEKGDVLLLSFYARCEASSDESAMGAFRYSVVMKGEKRFSSRMGVVGKKWKRFYVPFEAAKDDAVYSVRLLFGGVKPETIEIGRPELINYRDKTTVDRLPRTEAYYPGIEKDAPWRKAAAERIREYRMEDLKVRVIDRYGHPVAGAKVHVRQKSHAYGFGMAVSASAMTPVPRKGRDAAKRTANGERYREAFLDLFNKATIENRLKWKYYRVPDPELEALLDWFGTNGISVRGHCMVWPAWRRLPDRMKAKYEDRQEEFRGVIDDHVREMANLYPKAFCEWDVANELYAVHQFVDFYGREVVAEWFRVAKEASPAYTCWINDYAILAGEDQSHQDGYYEWIDYLVKQGAPLEGIGMQGHFRLPTPPEELLRRLDRFATFGLPIQITEYTLEDDDPLLQARYTRDFMTVVFSHPKTVGIVAWCMWEGSSYSKAASFFDLDWNKKAAAKAWEHTVETCWHTDETVKTGKDGTATVRGFLGEYEIDVSHARRRRTLSFRLEKGADMPTVRLK